VVSFAHAARDLSRLGDISRVLVRHGFGEVVSRLGLGRSRKSGERTSEDEELRPAPSGAVAVRIRRVLEELGPSFVKLGQIMSTRADLLPPDVLVELKKLLDDVNPVPFKAIAERIEASLGAPIAELFLSFEEQPLAAASVAQVHRARLATPDGPAEVVVKVQRPGIAETIALDLDLLHTFASLLERAVPETRIYSPTSLVRHFDRAVQSELDFNIEADNAARFVRNFSEVKGARFPLVYREVSSKHVLTLEFLDGKKIYEAIRCGFDARQLSRLAMGLVVKQVFEDGFFHADPHPGNVLVLGTPDAPEYALIDLGLVGRLGPRMRDLTVDLMVAAARQDFEAVADAMYAICSPTKKVDMRVYRADVALLAERYVGRPLKDVEVTTLVHDLISTANRFGLEVPPDFLLVGKALLTVEGVGKEIAPDFDIFAESKPLFVDLLRKRYSPERLGSELLRRVERLSGATSQLPEQLQEILEDLRLGRLSIRISDTNLRDSADRLGRRLFSAVISSACLLTGASLWVKDHRDLGSALMGLAVLIIVTHWLVDGYRGLTRRS
jgi:ubiquinone biosynthesis protein